jgi:hypothetical protein
MAVAIGAALAGNALVLGFALSVGRQLFINDLAGTTFGPASGVFYDTLLVYLRQGVRVVACLGLVLVVAGWFSGRNSTGTAVRSTVSAALVNAGSRLSAGSARGVGRWVAANATSLRVVAGIVGVVGLMWGNEATPTRLLWSTLAVVGLLVAIQVLVGVGRGRQGTSESPGEVPAAQPGGS